MSALTDVDLFGNETTPFTSAHERYGVWPTTVWPVNHSRSLTKSLLSAIGDAGEARSEVFTKATDDKSVYRGKVTTSIFSPELAALCLNMYGPKQGLVLDPFAGGGTRALMTASLGLAYLGAELRAEEVEAVMARARAWHLQDFIHVEECDACDMRALAGTATADFLLTCPPYWNLEEYGGGERDLSSAPTYALFLDGLAEVIAETYRVLKPGAASCWVAGLIRDKQGALLPLPHDIARLHVEAGFRHKEEVIVHHTNTGSIQRVGQFEKGDRRLVRVHEYVEVFTR